MMALRAAPRRARWLAGALLAPGAARAAPLAACVPAPPLPGPLSALPPARFASSGPQGPEGEGPQRRVVVVRITNPLAWLRTRFYYLLIRLYFDSEFSIEEFTRGAKQVGPAAAAGGSGLIKQQQRTGRCVKVPGNPR